MFLQGEGRNKLEMQGSDHACTKSERAPDIQGLDFKFKGLFKSEDSRSEIDNFPLYFLLFL